MLGHMDVKFVVVTLKGIFLGCATVAFSVRHSTKMPP